ncbi:MAG TPA: FprA family A-type flavoprotein, partial [Candidatus Limnocylindria bacterium]|nr:FprA family A-type flavoprotein [Candidatus Limnocylindria bacterium]
MHATRQITPSVFWVGANDRRLALFENMFPLPDGVAYNSYVILDEKVALLDTVDASVTRPFLENLEHVLGGRPIDYLVVNHMEPDHCANIEELCRRFPDMRIVGNPKTFGLIRQFYDFAFEDRTLEVREGDTLPLGAHTLRFDFAPMVHWPEVMLTYEESEGILFSADAFGSFGALPGNVF